MRILLGGAEFGTPAIVLGTAVADGSAETVVRSDATVLAFDATVPSTMLPRVAAAAGSAVVAARRDHAHGGIVSAEWFALVSLMS